MPSGPGDAVRREFAQLCREDPDDPDRPSTRGPGRRAGGAACPRRRPCRSAGRGRLRARHPVECGGHRGARRGGAGDIRLRHRQHRGLRRRPGIPRERPGHRPRCPVRRLRHDPGADLRHDRRHRGSGGPHRAGGGRGDVAARARRCGAARTGRAVWILASRSASWDS